MPRLSILRLLAPRPRLISPAEGMSARDPQAELEQWLAQMPQRLPLTRARMLGARLKAMAEVDYSLRIRLRLLESIENAAMALAGEIEAQLDAATLPLPRPLQAPLVATLGTLKLLSTAYLETATRITRRWVAFGAAKSLRIALERGTTTATRRLALAHRAYTIGSTSTWKQLYAFQVLARERGCAAARPLHGAGALSIEHTYAHALLLAAADPTCIAPGDLDRVRFYLQRHVRLCRFMQAGDDAEALQRQAQGLFVISNSGHPPVALTRYRQPLQPHHWLLDCRDMLARLQGQIDGLRLGVVPARLGLPIAARQPRYVNMLETLHEHWARPRSRTHGRTRFLPRTDMVVGFDAIRRFLAGNALRRRADDSQFLEPLHERTSEWGILDESPGGFGLRYLSGQAQHVRVGEVVAVRPRERAAVLLCVARRAVNRGTSDFDIGLEIIAPSAIAADITLPGPSFTRPRRIPVLLLAKVPALGGRPALLAALGDAPPGTLITLTQHGQRLTLRTGLPSERLPALELLPLQRV